VVIAGVVRGLALTLAVWLPLSAQSTTAILHIRIVEGEGVGYPAGSRATRGVTVEVTGDTGKPVEGAMVTFQLPADGPAGTFASGGRMETLVTGADGRVSVWGMRWNRTVGPFELRITASKGPARAGAVCPLYITEAAAQERSGLGKHGKLWIALAVAGGVLAAAALKGGGSSTSASSAAVSNPPVIGTPTVAISPP
jgi:hypothetical protein